jgi:hypothetical protein
VCVFGGFVPWGLSLKKKKKGLRFDEFVPWGLCLAKVYQGVLGSRLRMRGTSLHPLSPTPEACLSHDMICESINDAAEVSHPPRVRQAGLLHPPSSNPSQLLIMSGTTWILGRYQEISWICLKITTVPGSGISCDGLLVVARPNPCGGKGGGHATIACTPNDKWTH